MNYNFAPNQGTLGIGQELSAPPAVDKMTPQQRSAYEAGVQSDKSANEFANLVIGKGGKNESESHTDVPDDVSKSPAPKKASDSEKTRSSMKEMGAKVSNTAIGAMNLAGNITNKMGDLLGGARKLGKTLMSPNAIGTNTINNVLEGMQINMDMPKQWMKKDYDYAVNKIKSDDAQKSLAAAKHIVENLREAHDRLYNDPSKPYKQMTSDERQKADAEWVKTIQSLAGSFEEIHNDRTAMKQIRDVFRYANKDRLAQLRQAQSDEHLDVISTREQADSAARNLRDFKDDLKKWDLLKEDERIAAVEDVGGKLNPLDKIAYDALQNNKMVNPDQIVIADSAGNLHLKKNVIDNAMNLINWGDPAISNTPGLRERMDFLGQHGDDLQNIDFYEKVLSQGTYDPSTHKFTPNAGAALTDEQIMNAALWNEGFTQIVPIKEGPNSGDIYADVTPKVQRELEKFIKDNGLRNTPLGKLALGKNIVFAKGSEREIAEVANKRGILIDPNSKLFDDQGYLTEDGLRIVKSIIKKRGGAGLSPYISTFYGIQKECGKDMDSSDMWDWSDKICRYGGDVFEKSYEYDFATARNLEDTKIPAPIAKKMIDKVKKRDDDNAIPMIIRAQVAKAKTSRVYSDDQIERYAKSMSQLLKGVEEGVFNKKGVKNILTQKDMFYAPEPFRFGDQLVFDPSLVKRNTLVKSGSQEVKIGSKSIKVTETNFETLRHFAGLKPGSVGYEAMLFLFEADENNPPRISSNGNLLIDSVNDLEIIDRYIDKFKDHEDLEGNKVTTPLQSVASKYKDVKKEFINYISNPLPPGSNPDKISTWYILKALSTNKNGHPTLPTGLSIDELQNYAVDGGVLRGLPMKQIRTAQEKLTSLMGANPSDGEDIQHALGYLANLEVFNIKTNDAMFMKSCLDKLADTPGDPAAFEKNLTDAFIEWSVKYKKKNISIGHNQTLFDWIGSRGSDGNLNLTAVYDFLDHMDNYVSYLGDKYHISGSGRRDMHQRINNARKRLVFAGGIRSIDGSETIRKPIKSTDDGSPVRATHATSAISVKPDDIRSFRDKFLKHIDNDHRIELTKTSDSKSRYLDLITGHILIVDKDGKITEIDNVNDVWGHLMPDKKYAPNLPDMYRRPGDTEYSGAERVFRAIFDETENWDPLKNDPTKEGTPPAPPLPTIFYILQRMGHYKEASAIRLAENLPTYIPNNKLPLSISAALASMLSVLDHIDNTVDGLAPLDLDKDVSSPPLDLDRDVSDPSRFNTSSLVARLEKLSGGDSLTDPKKGISSMTPEKINEFVQIAMAALYQVYSTTDDEEIIKSLDKGLSMMRR